MEVVLETKYVIHIDQKKRENKKKKKETEVKICRGRPASIIVLLFAMDFAPVWALRNERWQSGLSGGKRPHTSTQF